MMRKGGTSSAPSTPRGSNGRGSAQPAEEHHIVATTFVQADVNTFRELVQKLTGGPPSPLPQQTPALDPANGKEISPGMPLVRGESSCRPESEKMINARPVGGGPGPQRTSTAKLLERRQNARKLEVKQLMGPHILKRTAFPAALSPVSPLSTIDLFSENSGATSPLGYMGCSPAAMPFLDPEQQPRSSSPGFDLNSGLVHLELDRRTASPREPRLLPLFPLHSPRSSSS